MSERDWRVAWHVKDTIGVCGHGEAMFSEEEAKHIAEAADKEWPIVSHWAERAPSIAAPQPQPKQMESGE